MTSREGDGRMSAGDRELIRRARNDILALLFGPLDESKRERANAVGEAVAALADRLEAREGWRGIESAPEGT
jgi:hypothetical protein